MYLPSLALIALVELDLTHGTGSAYIDDQDPSSSYKSTMYRIQTTLILQLYCLSLINKSWMLRHLESFVMLLNAGLATDKPISPST